ncbi:hypothetical protein RGU77_13205 [Actimicrobium sp. CCI2.3]|uniref:hypothetical protein n=1 Tax=Actimicrobium sp. CCI2.3 TaxID=3048616 RepID=UPI002AB5ABC2|nr:hypothetical protein [Actimicrobium sp. CCI2.3]MDY7575227.1 hypothetical protein [Actimicrobium sp. CCI2.3]MEB0022310.1 hypothetical protein [Actimicrobium sp. CCI2.3]
MLQRSSPIIAGFLAAKVLGMHLFEIERLRQPTNVNGEKTRINQTAITKLMASAIWLLITHLAIH